MGEIADMMLDGTMCASCGEWMHDGEDGPGFPGLCAGCAPHEEKVAIVRKPKNRAPTPKDKRVACPMCGKSVGVTGIGQHIAAKHVTPDGKVTPDLVGLLRRAREELEGGIESEGPTEAEHSIVARKLVADIDAAIPRGGKP